MNLLLAFIPLVLNSFTTPCECDTYYSFLEQAKNAEAIVVGEVIALKNPYSLPSDQPLTPDAPNRHSALRIKVVDVIKGEVSENNIKIYGYSYFSDSLTDEQPYRLGFEYVRVGTKILFCLNREHNKKEKIEVFGLMCCGASLLGIDDKNNVAGKIEDPEIITTKPLQWVVSQIKP